MKRLIILIMLLIGITLTAQVTKVNELVIKNPLEDNTSTRKLVIDPVTGKVGYTTQNGGGTQNLQQTLANGKIAVFEDSNLLLLQGDPSNRIFQASLYDTPNNRYSLITANFSGLRIENESISNNTNGSMGIENGNMYFIQTNKAGPFSTSISFETPLDNTAIKFPAKTAGNFIVATTDEVTLQNIVDTDANSAYKTNANAEILAGTDNNRRVTFYTGNGVIGTLKADVELSLSTAGLSMGYTGGSTSEKETTQRLEADYLLKYAKSGTEKTEVIFETPTGASVLKYPAPIISGTYTLATTSDVAVPVSISTSGIVNNVSLQELGGVDKTIRGIRIGKGNSSGIDNVVFGINTQTSASTAIGNHSFGFEALRDLTTGIYNNAFGFSALQKTTIGTYNSAFGNWAMFDNLSGNFNVAMGSSALRGNTTGSQNVAIGPSALRVSTTASNNTAVGSSVLVANTTGDNNVGFGLSALFGNTIGISNTAVGANSLFRNISGTHNTAVGQSALGGQVAGGGATLRNIGVGAFAGQTLETGNNNIFLGSESAIGTAIRTGNFNVFIGKMNNGFQNGDANVFIGNVTAPTANMSANIILSDGNGVIGLQKTATHELIAPSVTNVLIQSEATGKALITKEYINRTFTVATLPTPASGVAYATVTDATAPTYLGTLTGGGSVVCPVFYNGTIWVSH